MAISSLKPVKIYIHGPSPNPWKVIIILEELGIPWESESVPETGLKTEPFISLNPNGRTPALIDPNNDGTTLWESGAIIDYLIDVYDKDHTLQYTSFPEKHITRCWEHFQMSGQGPYMGQKGFFMYFHPEKLPSAIERYDKETRRIIGVVDAHLSKQGTPYLVGDKVTYADLMFVPYFKFFLPVICPDLNTKEWPKFDTWLEKLVARPSVQTVLAKIQVEKEKKKLPGK
ncbi:glutathione-s-transferase theta, gst [Lipomyces tetrasporus]